MNTTFDPEIADLRNKVEGCVKELAEMRGTVNQLNQIVSASVRQSVWQLIALIVSLCVTMAGGLAYQASVMDKRFEQIEKRVEQSERNMTARFEDFKQEVRAQRK